MRHERTSTRNESSWADNSWSDAPPRALSDVAIMNDMTVSFMVRRMLKKFGKLVESDFATAGAAA